MISTALASPWIEKLSRLPAPIERICSLSRHEGSSARHIAAACGADPALAARVLAVVNSPALGPRRPVPDLLQAAVVLGMNRIRNLVLAAHLSDALVVRAADSVAGRFLKHSLAVAEMARALGRAAAVRESEDMYLAGLLHDLGLAALLLAHPGFYAGVAARAGDAAFDLAAAERDALGASHPEVGHQIAHRWPIDEKVLRAVLDHHAPIPSPAGPPTAAATLTEAVVIAEHACRHHGWGFFRRNAAYPEDLTLPGWVRSSPSEIIALFPPAALTSEETRGRLGGE
jgi:putative nucleotidyltransferase with HDIG domain